MPNTVYWDDATPGFGVKATRTQGLRRTFRTGGAGSLSRVRQPLALWPGALDQARAEARKVLAARLEGRDPAAEKREAARTGMVQAARSAKQRML